MNDHLSSATLNALADGELSGDELVRVNEHLATCPPCTSNALAQSLLKSATGRAGQRYSPSPDLRERLTRMAAQEAASLQATPSESVLPPQRLFVGYGWLASAAALMVCAGLLVAQHITQQKTAQASKEAALVTEVSDQHIAALAGNAPPEVISSDRHTVKPWFQGKLPFSFDLPQDLPADTTLDGANLTYLHGQPAAQLLYSIGKHRVSVFLQQGNAASASGGIEADHAGFHETGFHSADLEAVGVSDVDPSRLKDLMTRIERAQAGAHQSSN